MKDPEALTYNEIDIELLENTLKSDGMVFVRLSPKQAKAFIKLYERGRVIEKYNLGRPGFLRRQFNLIMAVISLIKVFIFHMRLMDLDAFRSISKVRCTWEIQPEGDYVLIFS